MKHFVNEYHYTPEYVQEYSSAWCEWKSQKTMLILAAVSVLILIYVIFAKDPMALFLEIAALGGYALMNVKKKQAINQAKNRMQQQYPTEAPVLRVEIGKAITLKTPKNERTMQFSEVKTVLNTPNLFVVCSKTMAVVLAKNGFTEGSAENCRAYLKEKTGR